ncbi:MAG: amidohydrolase family protein [Eubacteriales bacterium]|nr:amidohydrolase family protein [Eubacteriales bacterium]
MSRILTSRDILPLIRDGQTELELREGDNLTDLAREMLRDRGVRAVPARNPEVYAPDQPTAPGSLSNATRQSATQPDGQETRNVFVAQAALASNPKNTEPDPYDLVITGGICVVPEMGRIKANVCIRDGKIAALTTDRVRGKQEIDATGLYVLPGVIDPHTHLGLFVPFEQELESETRSAVLGGVTTIGTYFNQTGSYLPLIDRLEHQVNTISRVDMIPHLAIREDTQVSELAAYSQRGMNSFKVYMCGVPGLYPHQEDGFIIRVMERMAKLLPTADPILSVHCENTSICDFATEDMKDLRLETLSDWNLSHPNLAEGEAVIRAAYFSQKTGARTYIVHSSTKEAMEALHRIKHAKLSVETTSPYLCLDTDSDIGAYGKMLPPIREPESRDALWQGIRDGIIDTIGTDNTVMTAEEKRVSEGMRKAGAGYPTLGTHLASVLNEGIFRREISIEKLVPLITMNPAKIFHVYPRKGTIMPGSDADIVLVNLDIQRTVNPSELLSRSDFSLFQGKTLRAWPMATIKGGRILAWNGKLVDDTRRGNVLKH